MHGQFGLLLAVAIVWHYPAFFNYLFCVCSIFFYDRCMRTDLGMCHTHKDTMSMISFKISERVFITTDDVHFYSHCSKFNSKLAGIVRWSLCVIIACSLWNVLDCLDWDLKSWVIITAYSLWSVFDCIEWGCHYCMFLVKCFLTALARKLTQ